MTHKIVKNGNIFEIHELQSSLVVSIHDSHADASKRYKFLKKGGAFHGFTPPFFLTSVKDLIKNV